MISLIAQYKLLFFLSWIICYFIFPAWALPVSVKARFFIFFGLIVYFSISAYAMHRWFKAFTVVKPVIVRPADWGKNIRNNLWLAVVCCIAALLHVYPILFPLLIIGDEALHLTNGLWIYEYIDSNLHKYFQILFWALIGFIMLVSKLKAKDDFILERAKKRLLAGISNNSLKYYFVFLCIAVLFSYFFLLRELTHSLILIRYPPVSKFLYFATYAAFGINHIFPRILQLIFYLLCAFYLYRTINLFYAKETALLGTSIYLFLPITFLYAHLGELESGVICLIAVNSFYFLRYMKDGDIRDLLLSSYLIGIGFLYKDPVFLVFPVCLAFLIFYKVKNHMRSLLPLKILFLAPITVIPWMIIEKLFSWRNYKFQLSNFISLNGKMFTYPLLLSANLSEPIFIILILAAIYICIFKRNMLTVFFGLLFIVYYFFIVSDIGSLSPRFSMAFYPTIVVFLSLFISQIIQTIKWKHAFTLSFIVLTIYLIAISAVSPLNKRFLIIENKKLKYFPSETAMRWVKENVKAGEKIITVRIMSSDFYQIKYGIDKNRIIGFWYEIEDISTPEKLRAFYKESKASYIMFPYRPDRLYSQAFPILQYLKDNRDGEFLEVAQFNLEDNFIYVYKLKEI